MARSRPRALTTILAFLALIVVALLVVSIGGRWFLTGGRFRRHLNSAVGSALQARASFSPLHFAGSTFFSDGFVAQGKRHAHFSELRAAQVHAVVNWHGLLDRRWEIDNLKIQNLDVELTKRPAQKKPPAAKRPPRARKSKHEPWKLDLRKAEVAQSSWHWGLTPGTTGSISGIGFTVRPNDDAWLLEAHGGTLRESGFPPLAIVSARLRYRKGALLLNESSLRVADGRINLTGEINPNRAADFAARFNHVSIAPLLPLTWRERLRAHVAGIARMHAPLPRGDRRINADVQLTDGSLEKIPLLEAIASFTRSNRFRRVPLTRGSLSIADDGGLVTIKNLTLESAGLMRVEGGCTILSDQIDGVFQLGLTANLLRMFPGAQKRVFTAAHEGYYWTPLRLTGSVAHPHEDLTPRLTAAAAEELLKNPKKTLRDLSKALQGLLPP